jgi:aspartyl/asparaginyl-tRNA synthetase
MKHGTQYTIEFENDEGKFTHPNYYYVYSHAESIVKDTFKANPVFTKATIYEWNKSIKEFFTNEDPEVEKVKSKITDILMGLSGAERRKKVVKHFWDIFNKNK